MHEWRLAFVAVGGKLSIILANEAAPADSALSVTATVTT
jgi:hypothetical protein